MDAALMHLLPSVQDHILARGITIPAWRATDEERQRFAAAVAQTIVELRLDRQNGHASGGIAALAGQLAGMLTGVGVLNPLLADDATEEIIVRQGHVMREHAGAFDEPGVLADDSHFAQIADRVADQGQRVMTGQRPYVLVDLPNGDRFTAIKPPLSIRGTAINIRHFSSTLLSLGDLARRGTFDEGGRQTAAPGGPPPHCGGYGQGGINSTVDGPDSAVGMSSIARFLAQVVSRNLASILVSGEFGAGKTTLLSALSQHISPRVQLAVVESFAELKVAHPHPLRVVVPEREQRADHEAPTMDDVLNVVITRMRPDLLIIGEIVRDEAARFLDAINLGKKAWSTIHGNDALGALYRLETKALTTGLPHQAIREQIAAGVNLVVHLRREPVSGRRYVAQVARVQPQLVNGRYDLNLLWNTTGDTGAELDALWQAGV